MESIDRDTVHRVLRDHEDRGFRVDERVFSQLQSSDKIFGMVLGDPGAFLSLIWQESDPDRLLTPQRQPRTLADVIRRLERYSFEQLTKQMNFPGYEQQPEWFAPCVAIERSFSYEAFEPVSLAHPLDTERKQSPSGSFYILDGVHKTIVLARLLAKSALRYQPVAAFLFVPRRL